MPDITLIQCAISFIQLVLFIALAGWSRSIIRRLQIGTEATIKAHNSGKRSARIVTRIAKILNTVEPPTMSVIESYDDISMVEMIECYLVEKETMCLTLGTHDEFSKKSIVMKFENIGGMPASLDTLKVGMVAAKTRPDPILARHVIRFPLDAVVRSESIARYSLPVTMFAPAQHDLAQVIAKKCTLWFFGQVIYRDSSSRNRPADRRSIDFCAEWNGGHFFLVHGGGSNKVQYEESDPQRVDGELDLILSNLVNKPDKYH